VCPHTRDTRASAGAAAADTAAAAGAAEATALAAGPAAAGAPAPPPLGSLELLVHETLSYRCSRASCSTCAASSFRCSMCRLIASY
jgi:hypothetical protein